MAITFPVVSPYVDVRRSARSRSSSEARWSGGRSIVLRSRISRSPSWRLATSGPTAPGARSNVIRYMFDPSRSRIEIELDLLVRFPHARTAGPDVDPARGNTGLDQRVHHGPRAGLLDGADLRVLGRPRPGGLGPPPVPLVSDPALDPHVVVGVLLQGVRDVRDVAEVVVVRELRHVRIVEERVVRPELDPTAFELLRRLRLRSI